MYMSFDEAEDFLKALGDETRLKIIDFIKKGERSSIEIQDALKKSQSTVSQHLKVLVDENILSYQRDNAKKIYKIKHPEILGIISSVIQFLVLRNQEKVEKLSDSAISDTLRS